MRQRRTVNWLGLAAGTGVSLLVHLALLPVLQATLLRPIEPEEFPPVAGEPVPLLSAEEVEALMANAPVPPEELQPVPLPPEPPKPKRPKGQIVEIPPPEREETPDDARFLSEYDSKVDKEMISANNAPPTPAMRESDRRVISTGQDIDGSMDGRRDTSQTPEQRRAAKKTTGDAQRRSDRPRTEQQTERVARERTEQASEPLEEGTGPFAPAELPGDEVAAAPESGGQVGGAPAPPSYKALLPTLGPEDLAQMDGSIDHVDDVDKGERTFLNAREYKYAWFFNRVKRSVQQRWRAVDVHRRYDPYGRVYGVRDRLTVVEVTLDPDGSLDDIYIKQDSGVAFLDEAALRAFRDAAPFPNPPEGLRDDDGRIRFSFGFYLEINGRGFRMFRYR